MWVPINPAAPVTKTRILPRSLFYLTTKQLSGCFAFARVLTRRPCLADLLVQHARLSRFLSRNEVMIIMIYRPVHFFETLVLQKCLDPFPGEKIVNLR
jgi:hypothetical protein